MHRRFFLVLFTLVLASAGSSLDIHLNGQPWKQFTPEALDSLSYPVDPADPGKRGISLDEVLPPLYNAYRLSASAVSGEIIWEGDDLADFFHQGYLSLQGETLSMAFQGRSINGVKSLKVQGELITDRTLEVWISWEGPRLLKEEIQRYADLHDTDIRVIEVPKTSSKLLSVLRGGGNPPDLLMVQSSDIPTLLLANALQPLGYLNTEDLDIRGKEAFTTGGSLWGIPFYCDPQIVFINNALIPENPDFHWTLEDYENLSADLLVRGITPSAWNAYSASWLIPFQLAFGKKRLVEPDGSIIVNDRPSVEALEYLLDLEKKGYLEVLERDAMVSLFVAGKVAMILSGSYSIPGFEDIDLDFSVVPYPLHPSTGRAVAPLLDYKAFCMTRRTRHPVLARRLVEYLSGIGVQQRFPPRLSKLPVHLVSRTLSETVSPHFSALAVSSERGIPIPPEKAYGEYKNTMWSLLRFAFTGQMSAQEVLNQCQTMVEKKMVP
ncbi:MAG: extracellular solute-binding protein [Spirochaetales bacterium]|nr:extracellular solute-binding protein [Spirochaetales bacterium]